MIPDARAFPGVPTGNGGFQAGGAVSTFTTSLAAPPAGSRQYLALITVTFRPSTPATETMEIRFLNLDVAGGTMQPVDVQTLTGDGKVYAQAFWPWWSASGLATAIGISVTTASNNNFSVNGIVCAVNLFGYNVAE